MRRTGSWLLGLIAAVACGGGGGAVDRNDELLHHRRDAADGGSLLIMSMKLEDAELVALLADPRVPALHELNLHDNRLTAGAVHTVMTSPKTGSLRLLNLTTNRLGDDGLSALAGWSGLATVSSLYLSANGASERGVRAITTSPHLGALTHLDIGLQPVGDGGAIALAEMRAVPTLWVEVGEIGGLGARTLIEQGKSTSLHLSENPIGPGGLVGLGAISPSLDYLALSKCGLDGADMQALAAAPAPALTGLDVSGNPFGDAGVRAVAGAAWLGRLETLEIVGSKASSEAKAELIAAWGGRAGLTMDR